nr:hypothetical protein [uncultured Shinella sp.]
MTRVGALRVLKLTGWLMFAACVYLAVQIVVAAFEINDQIDRCMDDTSPAYITDPQLRDQACK